METKSEYLDSGVRYEFHLVNHKIEGIATWFHTNNKKYHEGKFKIGQKVGYQRRWNFNGTMDFEEIYKKNFQHGAKVKFEYLNDEQDKNELL